MKKPIVKLGTGIKLALSFCILSIGLFAQADTPPNPNIVDDPVAEAQRIQDQQKAAYEALTKNNPLAPPPMGSPDRDPSSDSQDSQMQMASQFLNHPFVQRMVKTFADPGFAATAEKLAKSPNNTSIAYAEIGLLVFFIVIRAWMAFKLAKSRWFLRLVLKLATGLTYLLVSSIVIPVIFLGDAYLELVGYFLKILGL